MNSDWPGQGHGVLGESWVGPEPRDLRGSGSEARGGCPRCCCLLEGAWISGGPVKRQVCAGVQRGGRGGLGWGQEEKEGG